MSVATLEKDVLSRSPVEVQLHVAKFNGLQNFLARSIQVDFIDGYVVRPTTMKAMKLKFLSAWLKSDVMVSILRPRIFFQFYTLVYLYT